MRTARVLLVCAGLGISALAAASPALGVEAVMCKAKEEKCAEANRYAVGTKLTAPLVKGSESILESAEWRTWCAESQIAGESTALTGGEVTALSFAACKPLQKPPGIKECYAVEVLHLPYTAEFVTKEQAEGIGVERLRLSAGPNGNPALKLSCEVAGFKFWCAYSGEELDLLLVGGKPAELWANKVLLTLSEFSSKALCATAMGWLGMYTVTAPSPLFFSGL